MRAFVAVEVPDRLREAVWTAVEPVRTALPKLRWVTPERYHLTVVFLGSVSDEQAEAVAAVLDSVAADTAPFSLATDGRLGTFGRRVLWAGLEESPEMTALAGRLTEPLRGAVALPDEDRPFHAHLTLARAGRKPVRSAALKDVAVPVIQWPVERVVLMASAGGYRVVHAAQLAPNA